MGPAVIGVVLHPMLVEVLVTGEHGAIWWASNSGKYRESRLVRTEAVGARGEGRVVAKYEYIDVAPAVKPLDLPLHPRILLVITRDNRIEPQNEGITVTKGVSRIACQVRGDPSGGISA
jgi:hypothetical protein